MQPLFYRQQFTGELTLYIYIHTHLSDQSFFCDHLERVNNRDVPKPPGYGQSTVPILYK